ncbi:hypothetical protein E1B28_003627 [Marasmius oreades]|uniref:Uncharacterized protein n=1 Tax=Marasmius oreades TaxID=181124 RepID=A0A9P7RNF1_9AGAR|nr:uncharacterized protein E1B28_003627 [Marasmius oreades]KAG7086113.1 hypothetical protein E1B28_003627 [Marasmius oreades]
MPSLRALFVSITAAVACVTSAVAAPSFSPSPNSLSLVRRGTVFDPRCDCYQSPLPVVIDDCTSKITPLIQKLKSLDASDITSANIKPIADEIKSVLTDGIGHLNLLAKGNAEVSLILSTGNGTLSVSDSATLLAGLVNLVLGGVKAVLKLVALSDSTDVIVIFADLSVTLAEFLKISVSLVVDGGLLVAVLPLIKESLGVVLILGIPSYFHFLGLDLFSLGVDIGVGVGADVANVSTSSLVVIVKAAFKTIQPLAQQLKNLQASDCNSLIIGPIVGQIRAVLVDTVSQISLLVGKNLSAEVLLLLDGKVLTVNDCAGIIGELVIVIFDAICEVIKVIPASEAKAVIAIFVDVVLLVGQLIKISITLITFDGGLLVPLLPIIKEGLGLIVTVGLTDFYGFLNVDWTLLGAEVGVTIGAGVGGAGAVTTVVGAGTTILTSIGATVTGVFPSVPPTSTVSLGNSVGVLTTFVSTPVGTGSQSVRTGAPGNDDGEDDDGDYEDCDDDDTETGNGNSDLTTSPTGAQGGATTTATSTTVTNSGGSDVANPSTAPSTTATGATTITNGGQTDAITTSAASSSAVTILTTASSTTSGAVSKPSQCAGSDGSISISLVAVVQEVSVKVTPLVAKLKGISVADCTKDNIGGIVTEIKAIFTAAIAQIKVFVGASINVVLAKECGSDVILSVKEFADLFGTLINLVFGAIIIVLKTASGTGDYQVIISIFADLGLCIGELIKLTCDIVIFEGGLIVILVPIIKASLGICLTLGIKASFEFLQIDWTSISIDIGVGVGVGLSVISIVNNCTSTIGPLVEKLKSLSASDCTAGNIQPIIFEIKSAFNVCIEQIKLLVGASVEVVLASGSGAVVSVSECAKLIADLVNLVFGACGVVLKITVSAEYKAVIGLFADLGICIGEFIQITTKVVIFDGGLINVLIPLIHSSLALCVTLGIKASFEFLKIDWTQISVAVGVGATVSIVTILNNCTSTVTPLLQKLKDLKADECTADTIGPIVVEIKGVLSFCIEQIKALAGASVEIVLASSVGVVISVGDCANLVGDLVKLVLNTCAGVLKIAVAAELKAVISIFAELGVVVGTLIQTCVSVVTFDGGLLVVLVPIVKASLGVCIQLGITSSFEFLQIDFKQLAIDLGITVTVGVSVTLQAIIADLVVKITPLVEKLKGLNAGDCTPDTVGTIIGEIKAVVVASTQQVNGLKAGVSVSIEETTASIVGLLQLVFGALDAVLKIVITDHAKAVFGLCADLGSTIAVFLQSACSIDSGLQTSLLALVKGTLKDTFGVIIKLAITSTFSFLQVDFGGLCGELGLSIGGILNTLVHT